jgi:hypothetical protein
MSQDDNAYESLLPVVLAVVAIDNEDRTYDDDNEEEEEEEEEDVEVEEKDDEEEEVEEVLLVPRDQEVSNWALTADCWASNVLSDR